MKCSMTGKVTYGTREEAVAASGEDKPTKGPDKRAKRCDNCRGWHVSKERAKGRGRTRR